jgi:hypothetical protein
MGTSCRGAPATLPQEVVAEAVASRPKRRLAVAHQCRVRSSYEEPRNIHRCQCRHSPVPFKAYDRSMRRQAARPIGDQRDRVRTEAEPGASAGALCSLSNVHDHLVAKQQHTFERKTEATTSEDRVDLVLRLVAARHSDRLTAAHVSVLHHDAEREVLRTDDQR